VKRVTRADLLKRHQETKPRLKDRMSRLAAKIGSLSLLSLLLIGLALRFVLAPFTSNPNDTPVWYQVSNDLLAGLNVYTTKSFSYPPLWAYTLYPVVRFTSLFCSPKWFGAPVNHSLDLNLDTWTLPQVVTSPLFNIMYKLPLFITDAVIGLIIYDIVKKLRTERHAKLCFVLWFFNPLLIFVGAVHGQIDVLPALMAVLSFCLFRERHYIASGLAVGIGTLLKFFPFFLVPLYLFSIASLERDDSSNKLDYLKNLKRAAFQCSKFIGGMAIPFLIFVLPLINSNLFLGVFARVYHAYSIGGISLFSVLYLPGSEWLFKLIISNYSLVSQAFFAICLGGCSLIGFLVFRSSRESFPKAFLLGHVAVLTVIYTTSLLVNPQHILWVLPFLVLSYGLYDHFFGRLNTLSIAAFIFLMGIGGPLYVFYPTAIFTSLMNVQSIYATVYSFLHGIGAFLLLFSCISGIITVVSILKSAVASLLKTKSRTRMVGYSEQRDKKKVPTPRNGWHKTVSMKVLAFTFILLITGQFLVYVGPLTLQNVAFTIDGYNFVDENRVEVQYSIRSGDYPVDVQILAMPLAYRPVDKELFIYYDDEYPVSFVPRHFWFGFVEHLTVELQLKGYNGSVRIVDAEGLKTGMQNNDSIVIMASGVFPDTVYGGNESLVANWLHSGGSLVWIGDVLGYYVGHKGKDLGTDEDSPGWEAQNQTLGFSLLNKPLSANERMADTSSMFSNALNLRYSDALLGASVDEVQKHGGVVLGKTTSSDDKRTSIAYVPVGKGHLTLFGGSIGGAFSVFGEDVVAQDVAQILCSWFLFSTGNLTCTTIEFGRNELKTGRISVASYGAGQNLEGVIIVAFSKNPYVRFFARQALINDS